MTLIQKLDETLSELNITFYPGYCVDILVQVAAANSALNSFSKELLAQHISTCVADDLRAGSEEKLDELIKLLPKLMK